MAVGEEEHEGEGERTGGAGERGLGAGQRGRAAGRDVVGARERRAAGRDVVGARELLPLRVACGIGVADSLVALTTAIVARPDPVSVVAGICWVLAWAAALASAPRWAAAVAARAWVLAPLSVIALAPALLDGGYPGNLATQPMWIVLVAAALAGWRATLATGVALALGKLAVFLLTGTSLDDLLPGGADAPAEATTATLAPLTIALLGLVGVATLRRVLAALTPPHAEPPAPAAPLEAAIAPPPTGPLAASAARSDASTWAGPLPATPPPAAPAPVRLSPAERAVVALLADGLTPKQIAHARGTSLATVRTQIKRAKRATRARTLDELVASGWRPR